MDEYLNTEIAQGRIAGPLPLISLPGSHISRFVVIPKEHRINKWRLLIDLSYPAGSSVNDGIPKYLCSINYISIDTAIENILKCGTGTLLAKIDIKNAFRLLSAHPDDRYLLSSVDHDMEEQLLQGTCLPFGLGQPHGFLKFWLIWLHE